ncbi:hypothetical protein [Mycolicibacter virginiensis]|uniref:hypothetical protein n=1 Tax=Mycolicibacter virginiensis TaxID=1795032 RepID=UPI001F04A894|nr:hypothetical protein [Mycolicibacter virginiensis]ULP45879.1 hypothetical protein MJO54_13470 [Mycolicibacter virginiensis]
MNARGWVKGAVVAAAAAVAGGIGFGLGTVSGPEPERAVFSESTPVALRIAAESGRPVVWRAPYEEVDQPICHAWIGLPDGTAWRIAEISVALAKVPQILEQDTDITEGSGMGWGCMPRPGTGGKLVLPPDRDGGSSEKLPTGGGR